MPERPQLHRSCSFTHPSRTFLQVKTLHPTNISSTQKDPTPNKRCRIYLQRALNLNSDQKLAGVFALIISASSAPIFRNLCGSVVGKYYLYPAFNTLIAPSTVNSTVPQVTSPHSSPSACAIRSSPELAPGACCSRSKRIWRLSTEAPISSRRRSWRPRSVTALAEGVRRRCDAPDE
jgi:hypothetical protein